jgi:hypothetical protein
MKHVVASEVTTFVRNIWPTAVADLRLEAGRAVLHVSSVETMDKEITSGKAAEALCDFFEADGVDVASTIETGTDEEAGLIFAATFVVRADSGGFTRLEATTEALEHRAALDRFEMRMLIDGAKRRRGVQ